MALQPDVPLRSPGSTASLRAANQRRVIELLQGSSDRVLTQADIARATQLAPATVSNIVRDLSANGLLETTAGAGRRGTAVRFSRDAGLVAGVDVGHGHIRVVLGDLRGESLAETQSEISATHHHDEGLAAINAMLAKLLRELRSPRERIMTVGMGLPAPIGTDGRVVGSSILPGWAGVQATSISAEALGAPVHIDNDANLGALAEHRRGAGRGHSCMVYVKVSSGVGGGIIINGEVFRGGTGTAGEIGHLTIDENGPVCRCGSRGCLEAYASVTTVKELLSRQYADATFEQIVSAAKDGDAAAQRVLEDAGGHLGWGVAMLTNLINPTCLVVGGLMATAGDLVINPLRARMRRYALGSVGTDIVIGTAELGERSSVVGALLLAVDRTDLTLTRAAN